MDVQRIYLMHAVFTVNGTPLLDGPACGAADRRPRVVPTHPARRVDVLCHFTQMWRGTALMVAMHGLGTMDVGPRSLQPRGEGTSHGNT